MNRPYSYHITLSFSRLPLFLCIAPVLREKVGAATQGSRDVNVLLTLHQPHAVWLSVVEQSLEFYFLLREKVHSHKSIEECLFLVFSILPSLVSKKQECVRNEGTFMIRVHALSLPVFGIALMYSYTIESRVWKFLGEHPYELYERAALIPTNVPCLIDVLSFSCFPTLPYFLLGYGGGKIVIFIAERLQSIAEEGWVVRLLSWGWRVGVDVSTSGQ